MNETAIESRGVRIDLAHVNPIHRQVMVAEVRAWRCGAWIEAGHGRGATLSVGS